LILSVAVEFGYGIELRTLSPVKKPDEQQNNANNEKDCETKEKRRYGSEMEILNADSRRDRLCGMNRAWLVENQSHTRIILSRRKIGIGGDHQKKCWQPRDEQNAIPNQLGSCVIHHRMREHTPNENKISYRRSAAR
jgi:hypothetical protein